MSRFEWPYMFYTHVDAFAFFHDGTMILKFDILGYSSLIAEVIDQVWVGYILQQKRLKQDHATRAVSRTLHRNIRAGKEIKKVVSKPG